MSKGNVTLYEVGGCVRDRLLGVTSKDIDYAVEADSFAAMRDFLVSHRFEIFLETEQYLTIRARFPRTITPELADLIPPSEHLGRLTADFVLCRSDGDYTDGRRPDTVTAGTIYEDLARRDFTVNAVARRADGSLLDPHGGAADLDARLLRAVGDPADRIAEDALRALRAVRFTVTKGLRLDEALHAVLRDPTTAASLRHVSVERRREELHRTFKHSTPAALAALLDLGVEFLTAALGDNLIWLKPTTEE